MFILEVNWIAIFVAAVINVIIGVAWYSPTILGKQWKQLVEQSSRKKVADYSSGKMLINALTALVLSIVVSILTKTIGATTIKEGVIVGLVLWVGFVATTALSDYMASNRPIKLYLINSGYYLVSIVVMSAILAAWI